jgi:hypothetical protein
MPSNASRSVDNTMHPANPRLPCQGQRSCFAFNLGWEDTSGRNNAHYAPFGWQ